MFCNNRYSLGNFGAVEEVIWNFYKSPQTGKVGASKPLLNMFEEARVQGYNIRIQILDLPQEAIYQGARND